MKHLVTILAMFLLMGSQTSAQQNIPDAENLQEMPNFQLVAKPVICGPKEDVLKKVVEEFNETLISAWVDLQAETAVALYANLETGTSTVLEENPNKPWACIISQGMHVKLNKPEAKEIKEKVKGISIRYLTY